MGFQRPQGSLTVTSTGLVNLDLPGLIKFSGVKPLTAIKKIKECIGLSNHEREYLCRAIYEHTEKDQDQFLR